MQESELKSQKWKVASDLKIIHSKLPSVTREEAEFHVNIFKDDDGHYVTEADCSLQMYMTKLSKSELFTLTQALVSESAENFGYVLSIQGVLENKALTIRSRKRILSLAEKQALRDRMLKIRQVKTE